MSCERATARPAASDAAGAFDTMVIAPSLKAEDLATAQLPSHGWRKLVLGVGLCEGQF